MYIYTHIYMYTHTHSTYQKIATYRYDTMFLFEIRLPFFSKGSQFKEKGTELTAVEMVP